MLKRGLLALVLPAQPLKADDLSAAISCYRDSANAMDIDAHVACLAARAPQASHPFRVA